MKRLREQFHKVSQKNPKTLSKQTNALEIFAIEELCESIISHLDWKTIKNLRTTHSIFNIKPLIENKHFLRSYTLDQVYDFIDEDALLTYSKEHFNCHKLVWNSEFYKQLKASMEENIKIPLLLDYIWDFAKDGNILGLRQLLKVLKEQEKPFLCIRQDEYKISALAYAALTERTFIFDTLLQFYIDNGIPLFYMQKFCLERYELGGMIEINITFLHIFAIYSEDVRVLDVLNKIETLENLSKAWLCSKNYRQALIYILTNDFENFTELMDKDRSLVLQKDLANWSLLSWAVCFHHTEAFVKRLSFEQMQAQVLTSLNPARIIDNLAVFLATNSNNYKALNLFLTSNLMPTRDIDSGSTCLHLAALYGHRDSIKLLISYCEVYLNTVNVYDQTPLDAALSEAIEISDFSFEFSEEQMKEKLACAEIIQEAIKKPIHFQW